MSIRCMKLVLLSSFSGLLLLLILPGCAKQQAASRSTETVVAPAPAPRIVRQAEQDYYVDSRGALHLIVRQEIQTGGGLYYIEGDERAYISDPTGRLYYREPTGTVIYIEDLSPPPQAVIIPRQPEVYVPVAPARSMESCESQWRNCMAGCEGISPRQRYDRPNCISDCEAIRSGCPGR
ncbi:hypothetical protein [Fundidesulfovibrio terrae]|uniref:hypothetical protein n=1 Tax=Fundidesulfovibrio terrae TaxID=2922866 RepID=UPI001FAEB2AE|nr:hypothetical protein [Fundidesulfovibrio terrae]